jgi:hypothetical protein
MSALQNEIKKSNLTQNQQNQLLNLLRSFNNNVQPAPITLCCPVGAAGQQGPPGGSPVLINSSDTQDTPAANITNPVVTTPAKNVNTQQHGI